MATIYTQIEGNNRKTIFLITFFIILIIALGGLFSYWFNSYWILIIAIVIALVQTFSSYWWSDKLILRLSRAQPIEKKDNPELYRIIENLRITAGLPLPKIYIIPERQANAFATGRDQEHASIAITSGLLEKLNRSELEGVIAHELSHIKNKDILLHSVIVVLVSIVALLSRFFLRLSLFSSRRSKGGIIIFISFFAGILVAVLAPLAASVLQMAISRKREFLADASGALLTRYPEGLARALEKISSDPATLIFANESTAHLYIANPFRGEEKQNWLKKLFSTHPLIEERVERLRNM